MNIPVISTKLLFTRIVLRWFKILFLRMRWIEVMIEGVWILFVEYLSICQTVNGWGWGKFVWFLESINELDSPEGVF